MTRIQEIAQIEGYGRSAEIIRAEFDPLWGIEVPKVTIFRVDATVRYIHRDHVSLEIEADSESEAMTIAENELYEKYEKNDPDVEVEINKSKQYDKKEIEEWFIKKRKGR